MLFLAILASSFRMVTLYLPWEWSRPIVAHGPSATLRQSFLGSDDQQYTREVTVTVISTASADRFGDAAAAPGATLWRVQLQFEAAPDQMMELCTVQLVDATGTRYGHDAGQVAADGSQNNPTRMHLSCVPQDAPGPRLEPFTGDPVPSPVERPRSWRLDYVFATPLNVTPHEVRVGFDKPEYLVLQLP